MTVTDILSTIDEEIARLQQARALLAGTSTSTRGNKPPVTSKKTRGKRLISTEGRKRMAEAQRKRWAALKAAK